MKVNTGVVNMTAGEVSPRLDGRPDVSKQRNGLRICENFQVTVHGGLRKRSGAKFVCNLPVDADSQILQPFSYSTSDSYMLVFGDQVIFIAKDGALVTNTPQTITAATKANPGVLTTSGAHGFAEDDFVVVSGVGGMTELNNRLFRARNVTSNTLQLLDIETGQIINTTSYSTFTSGGTVSKLVFVYTPYPSSVLQELRFAQYNDVMYITHQNYATRKLSRLSNTNWTLSTVSLTTGPFRQINGDASRVMTVSPHSLAVTNISIANPCVVTVSGTNIFRVGDRVTFFGVTDTLGTAMNGNTFDVVAVGGQLVYLYFNSSFYSGSGASSSISYATTIWGTLPVGGRVRLGASWAPFVSQQIGSIWRLSEAGGGSAVSGAPLGNSEQNVNNGQVYTTDGKIYGISNEVATNWAAFNRVPNHEQGTVRVVGSSGTTSGYYQFDSSFLHPGYSIVQIEQIWSASVAIASVVRYQMPQSVMATGTSFWEEGALSDYRGWPRCCAFFEQRLWLAGSASDPATVWASRSGSFENFEDGANDDDAIVYRASSGYADTIRWMSGGRVLTAGTSQGEYAIAASNQNEALTPDNVRMLLQTTYGTSDCPPVRVNDAVLYPQRNGNPSNASRKLREFTYDFSADQFNSVDITIFAEHITGNGLTRVAYAMQPDAMIWTVRTDGQMPVCSYERLQEVVGWYRVRLGGTNAQAMCVGVCPGPSGDDVWAVTQRTVNGQTVRYLEVFQPPFEPARDAKADAKFLDAMLTYSGASTTTISGLWHLRGEAVTVLNNGNVETATVSSTGVLTLSRATTKAHVGLAYTGVIETQELEAGAQSGTAQGLIKRISQVRTRLLGSLGGSIGPPERAGNLDAFLYRTENDVMGSTPPLFSGLIETDFRGKHDREARIRIEHSEPLPFFVTALTAEQATQG